MRTGIRSERFQEAFERFEKVVDVDHFDSYRELWYAFRQWAGKRWRNTELQNRALAYDGELLHLPDVAMPSAFGHTVEETKIIMERRMARARREKWVVAYRVKAKKRVVEVKKKYKGVGKVRINALSWYVSRGYSANKIQKRLSERGIGIRRKKLLKIVREMRLKQKKAHPEIYIREKYRKKKSKKKQKKKR
jgi:hypothetical protein